MRDNVLHVELEESGVKNAGVLHQYDYGQRMVFTTEHALPAAYEVHFSNHETGSSITMIGDETGVDIPDALLLTGKTIWFWVFLHTGESDGETVYKGKIWVVRRAAAAHEEPAPVQQSEITQLINALNRAVAESETNVTHYPVIQGGVWFVWDPALEEYESTGIAATGPKGDKGDKGDTGLTPNVRVGSVTTGNAGTSAEVTLTGNTDNPVLNFKIPKGDPGEESVMVATQISGNRYRLGLGRE